jgi:sugar O-acyltransferase (sialic acid O-acetyltransferase NeuD family)
MNKIVMIGAGSFARDLVDAFGAQAFAGIYVDPEFAPTPIGGLPVFSKWEDVRKNATHYILGVSNIEHRERARAAAEKCGLAPTPPLVSRLAVVAGDATLAPGVAVGHMVTIGPAAKLDAHVLVMHLSVIGHDCVVGENTVLCAGVSLGGHVHVGKKSFVGANAVLAPKVNIGAECHISAGAACFRDAEDGGRWIGNPARRVALVTR